jgi:23S rRNA (cytidine1920-2'-O)/16S rRNA (cytidine1409-2'-O)-methyltransferase
VDCLLQNGARKVYAVDTAYGELAWTLRNKQKVVVMERTNAMHVELPEKVDLITIDVAWTRQEHIIPNALANLKASGRIITLIKPHYEAPKRYVSQGKLQADKISEVLESVERDIAAVGGIVQKMVKSPILGGKAKNEEYLALVVQAQS